MATVDFDTPCDDDFEEHNPFAVADSEHSDAARAEDEAARHAAVARRRHAQARVQKRMHRIAEVRQRQGVTLRNVARRLRLEMAVVRRQEQPDCDLRLSDVMLWQEVLEVPIAELLVEADGQLSGPVLERSRMVKLMKTAAALRERTGGTPTGKIVEMLVDQILEIMPELADVTPWNDVGQRRTLGEVGRTAIYAVPEEVFRRPNRS